jgi:hypothetical protein
VKFKGEKDVEGVSRNLSSCSRDIDRFFSGFTVSAGNIFPLHLFS